jgi:hypothetical protein
MSNHVASVKDKRSKGGVLADVAGDTLENAVQRENLRVLALSISKDNKLDKLGDFAVDATNSARGEVAETSKRVGLTIARGNRGREVRANVGLRRSEHSGLLNRGMNLVSHRGHVGVGVRNRNDARLTINRTISIENGRVAHVVRGSNRNCVIFLTNNLGSRQVGGVNLANMHRSHTLKHGLRGVTSNHSDHSGRVSGCNTNREC